MTTEHKYAHVLRWIADGKKVQFKCTTGVWVEEHPDHTITRIGKGLDGYDFRLAPRTVMIGDVECEAPLSECKHGENYFMWDATLNKASQKNFDGGNYDQNVFASKSEFATKKAAEAAHAAWVKLMTQP